MWLLGGEPGCRKPCPAPPLPRRPGPLSAASWGPHGAHASSLLVQRQLCTNLSPPASYRTSKTHFSQVRYLIQIYMSFQVLKINLIGHRKRILASLGDRLHDDPPQKPPRSITLRVSTRVLFCRPQCPQTLCCAVRWERLKWWVRKCRLFSR